MGEGVLRSIFESAKEYTEASIELLKLKAVEKAAKGISTIVSGVIVVVILIVFFFILNIGLSLYLGELLGKVYCGFFLVAGFYLLIGIVLWIFREKWLNVPLMNMIIRKVLK